MTIHPAAPPPGQYRRGKVREYKVRDHLAAHGWEPVMQAGGSKGAADLLHGHPVHGAALIQVGSKSKTLGPAERARLCHAAEVCNALALLAVVMPRRDPRYWRVINTVPSTWPEWHPDEVKP